MPTEEREGSVRRGGRARILDAAAALFASQGINATSVNELHAAARVSKRTLYQQFASKDELVLEYLVESERRSPMATVLARADLAARARLLELFTSLADRPAAAAAADPFIDALVEFPDPSHLVHRAAADHLRRFATRLGELARDAGARDPERVGRRLALLYEGAACQAIVDGDGAAAADAYAIAAALLRDAID